MLMDKVNKGGRPVEEPTSVRSIRVPDRVWKLVSKVSKDNRSINEYIISLMENDLIKKRILKKSARRSPVIKNNGGN